MRLSTHWTSPSGACTAPVVRPFLAATPQAEDARGSARSLLGREVVSSRARRRSEREAEPPPSAPQPSARVRMTLDLSREQHRFLRQFALDAESDASAILRALLAILEEDDLLAESVVSRAGRKYSR